MKKKHKIKNNYIESTLRTTRSHSRKQKQS